MQDLETVASAQQELQFDPWADVREFHLKFRPHHLAALPSMPSSELLRLSVTLVEEEFYELGDALFRLKSQTNFDQLITSDEHFEALAKVMDGVADLVYVLMGLTQVFGVDFRPVWRAVQRANMAKVGGETRADGKVLKPEGWQEPLVAVLLKAQAKAPLPQALRHCP
jgi:predicted HAD superfamily Cof-like phosphohydrolase